MIFKDTVRQYLNNFPMAATLLSEKFEVSKSTVYRWANGVANPHPMIKKAVVNYLKEFK